MTKGLDEGPILTQEALPIHSDQSSFDIELEKAIMAAKHIPHVLRMIAEGNPGKPQFGKGRYFSMADYRAITGIQDPAIISSSELTRRLRAFEHLQIKISGGWREVTKIAPLSDQLGKMGRFCFQTSDKVMIKPMRFRHLPFFIMRLVFTLFLKRISRIIAR
jgi:methionyl-tRNA formyltransferase